MSFTIIGFNTNQKNYEKGLGLGIIDGLTDQLGGKTTIDHLHKKGFAISITF